MLENQTQNPQNQKSQSVMQTTLNATKIHEIQEQKPKINDQWTAQYTTYFALYHSMSMVHIILNQEVKCAPRKCQYSTCEWGEVQVISLPPSLGTPLGVLPILLCSHLPGAFGGSGPLTWGRGYRPSSSRIFLLGRIPLCGGPIDLQRWRMGQIGVFHVRGGVGDLGRKAWKMRKTR